VFAAGRIATCFTDDTLTQIRDTGTAWDTIAALRRTGAPCAAHALHRVLRRAEYLTHKDTP
jgi:hypothetical protein